jgi:hypothetical protein
MSRLSHLAPRTSYLLAGAACAIALILPNVAAAQKKPRVVTISEVTIVGRVQKPIAAVDVSRIQPKLTLAELRQPFLDRIEKAIYNDPF